MLESVSMDWNPELNLVYNVATQSEISSDRLTGNIVRNTEEKDVDVMSLQPNFAEERKGDIRHSYASIESTTSDFS